MKNDGPVVGATWQGEYLLQATLGDPSHGVFRAQRRRDAQTVTIRIWRSPNDALAREFIEHASAACSIRHPTLAEVEACGREEHFCFIVTEYVVGQKLDTWADQVGIPPLGEVIDLMRRICEGLALAARSGVHHTALHPRNLVMLQGEPGTGRRAQSKLLDLGVPTLARPREPHALAAQFMAPEQLVSVLEPSQPALPPANGSMNVYSCGALLYYLCTGGPPYRHTDLAALRDAQVQGRLVLPSRINPQITPSLNAVITQALALDPKQRFASVAELAEALARVSLTPSVASARPVLSTVPPRAATVPPRMSPQSRASAVGLKRISSPPPISVPPGMRRPPPAAASFDDEPDTAKTGRVASLTGRPPGPGYQDVELDDDDFSEEEDANNRAPAGSFSSNPPPRASPPPKPPQGVVATPLALFSGAHARPEPPAPPARVDMSPPQLLPTHDVITVRPPPTRREKRPVMWLGALAAIACAALFGVVRLLGTSAEPNAETSPTVTVENPIVDSPSSSDRVAHNDLPSQTAVTPEPSAAAERDHPTPPPPPPFPSTLPLPGSEPDETNQSARNVRSRSTRSSSSTGASAASRELRVPSSVSTARELPGDHDASASRPAEVAVPTPPPAPDPTAQLDDSPPAVSKSTRALEPPPEVEPPRPPVQSKPTPAESAPEPVAKLPLEARSSIGEINLRGALPTSWVRRAVDRIQPQFVACYAKAAQAAGKNQFGALVVEVEIDERGRARNPSARGAKLAGLNECVAEAASKVISERAPDTGTVHASFKVNFTP